MRTTLFTIVLAAILLANVVQADLEVGSYAPDVEAKEWINAEGTLPPEKVPSLKELRGMVVVLFFWGSVGSAGQNLMEIINIVETNPVLGRRQGVTAIGLTDGNRKAVQPMLEEEKVFFPVGLESETHEDYKIESLPRVVIVDPDGKVAWSGWPGNTNEMIKGLRDVVAETPPRMTHPDEAELCRADLDGARDAIREQEWRSAARRARNAYERAVTGDPLKTLCQDMLDLIEALARDQIGEVDQLIDDEKYADAVAILRDVRRQFLGLDASRKAKKQLQALKEKYDEVRAILVSQQDDHKAAELYVEAREWVERRRLGAAYEQLELIVKDYDETDAADFAERMIERMQANAAVMAHVHEYMAGRECKMWLAQGRTYEAARRYDDARELYRQILDKYAGTKYAEEAERRLINLR